MAKLSDVAAEAGLSSATVSRYLNGRIDLPQRTRDRIDAAIDKLGYRPNALAQRLSTGRSGAIGLVVPDIANPFFAEIARGVDAEARAHGYAVLLSVTDCDPTREAEALRGLGDNAVEGLILASCRPDDGTLTQLLRRHRQVVLLDEDVPGAVVPGVFVDNRQGAYLAACHLIEAGHREIAMIGGPAGAMSMREREAGFTRALGEAGLPLRPGRVVAGEYTRAHGRAATGVLLGSAMPPTGIVALADVIAIGSIEMARSRGLNVPGDLSVTGFDDVEFADLVHPALTTVRQPIDRLGRLAVQRLIDQMADRHPPRETRLPVELVRRGSVAPPRAAMPAVPREIPQDIPKERQT